MRVTTVLLLLALALAGKSLADDSEITCDDLRSIPLVGKFFVWLSASKTENLPVHFYVSTNYNKESILIDTIDWTALEIAHFDPSKETYVIIHGFKSGGQKGWVLQLKDSILASSEANVLMIDWSSGSYTKNYVNAAKNTQEVSNSIFTILQRMRHQVRIKFPSDEEKNKWNNLYFIGHSLGAQVSAQTAYQLNRDSFWKVKRITGLDPASPCFRNVDSSLKLDTSDAHYVDVIHTQAGTGQSDGLGLKDSIGHVDFYVNGGMTQPECQGHWYTPVWKKMICSHKLAYKYFMESFSSEEASRCAFTAQSWNGTWADAHQCLVEAQNGLSCPIKGCPKMGINAEKSGAKGTYLVLVGKENKCQLEEKDTNQITKVINKLKGIKSIFQIQEPNIVFMDPNEKQNDDKTKDIEL